MSRLIMCVDDSSSIRQMVSFTLREAGYSVVEAVDEIGLIKEVRNTAENKFVPILMLTTESQAEKKQQGKIAGATGRIVKPFNRERLLTVLKKVLGY